MLKIKPQLTFILPMTFVSYGILLLLGITEAYQLEKNQWAAGLLHSIPLLLLLPGMITRYYRSYSWLCFLTLLYFINYVVQVYASNVSWQDWLGLCLTILLFIGGMLASRVLQRKYRDSNEELANNSRT